MCTDLDRSGAYRGKLLLYVRERVIRESHKLPPISCLCIFTIVMYRTYTSAVYWKERKCSYNHTILLVCVDMVHSGEMQNRPRAGQGAHVLVLNS